MTPVLRNPPPSPRMGPEFYWSQAKRFGAKGFTIPELHSRTKGVSYTTVKLYVHKLRDVGAVEVIGAERTARGNTMAKRYVAIKRLPQAPRFSSFPTQNLQGRRQWQLWTAMRAMKQFFVRELAAQSSTDDLAVSQDLASSYVTKLLAAGLILVVTPSTMRPGQSAGRSAGVYRLKPSANTGPAALKVIGNRVFDPNTNSFVGQPTDGSEVPA